MKRIGRKGEKTGERMHVYLKRVFKEMVDGYSVQTGKSRSEVIEDLIVYGDSEFRRRHSIGSEEDKSEKEIKKAFDREDAIKLSGRELTKFSQDTCAERYMNDIIFGRHSINEAEKSLMEIEPQSIWGKIVGR